LDEKKLVELLALIETSGASAAAIESFKMDIHAQVEKKMSAKAEPVSTSPSF